MAKSDQLCAVILFLIVALALMMLPVQQLDRDFSGSSILSLPQQEIDPSPTLLGATLDESWLNDFKGGVHSGKGFERLSELAKTGADFVVAPLPIGGKEGEDSGLITFPPTEADFDTMSLFAQSVASQGLRLRYAIIYEDCAYFRQGSPDDLLGYRPEGSDCTHEDACCVDEATFKSSLFDTLSDVIESTEPFSSRGLPLLDTVYVVSDVKIAPDDAAKSLENENDRWFLGTEENGNSGIWERVVAGLEENGITASFAVSSDPAPTDDISTPSRLTWAIGTYTFLSENEALLPTALALTLNSQASQDPSAISKLIKIYESYNPSTPLDIIEFDTITNTCDLRMALQSNMVRDIQSLDSLSLSTFSSSLNEASETITTADLQAPMFDFRGFYYNSPSCKRCTQNLDCDDGKSCNGVEQCISGSCYPSKVSPIDDGLSCTIDSCDETFDKFIHIGDKAESYGTIISEEEIGTVYEFDGKSYILSAGPINLIEPFTLSAWVNPKENFNSFYVISKTSSTQDNTDFGMATLAGTTKISCAAGVDSTKRYEISIDSWTHVTCVYDTNKISLAIDGEIVSTVDKTLSIQNRDLPLLIGKTRVDRDGFVGKIAGVQILEQAMSLEEILETIDEETTQVECFEPEQFEQGTTEPTVELPISILQTQPISQPPKDTVTTAPTTTVSQTTTDGGGKSTEVNPYKPGDPTYDIKILQGGPVIQKIGKIIQMKNIAYSPSIITINVGDMITWENFDSVTHTATGDDFDTGYLQFGKKASETFNTVGKYVYSCEIHPSMKGTIKVVESGASVDEYISYDEYDSDYTTGYDISGFDQVGGEGGIDGLEVVGTVDGELPLAETPLQLEETPTQVKEDLPFGVVDIQQVLPEALTPTTETGKGIVLPIDVEEPEYEEEEQYYDTEIAPTYVEEPAIGYEPYPERPAVVKTKSKGSTLLWILLLGVVSISAIVIVVVKYKKNLTTMFKGPQEGKLPPGITNYVSQMRTRGYRDEQIIIAMKRQGYSDPQIQQLLRSTAPRNSQRTNGNRINNSKR